MENGRQAEAQEQVGAQDLDALVKLCWAEEPGSAGARQELIATLPSLSGEQHGNYAYQLFALFEWKDQLANAEAVLDSSLKRDEVRDSDYFGYLLYALARVRRPSGDYVGALEALQELREHLPQIDHEARKVQLTNYEAMGRSLIHLDLGLISAARRSLARHSSFLKNGTRLPNVVSTEVQIELERGRTRQAIEILRPFVSRTDLDSSISHTLQALLGQALIESGNLEEGLSEIKESLSTDELRGTREAFARRAGALAHLQLGDFDAARTTLAPLGSRTLPPLNVAGYAAVRWRIAHESGAPAEEQAARLQELRTAYRNFLNVWKEVPIVEGGVGFFVPRRRRLVIEDVLRAELSQPAPIGSTPLTEVALQQVLDAQECGQLARQLGGHSLTVAKLKTRLAEDKGGVLIFVPVTDSTLVFAVDETGVTMMSLPGRQALRNMVRPAERDRAKREMPIAEFETTMEKFSEAILPLDLRTRIEGWKTIRFDGLDLITTIPPSMLRTPVGGWLGCERAVVIWPSCVVAHQLEMRRRKDSQTTGLLSLLDPDPVPSKASGVTPDLSPLPFDESELAQVANLGAESLPVQIRQGSSATLHSIAELRPSLLWVHAHGVVDPSRERAAGLVLSSSSDRHVSIWSADVEHLFESAEGPDLVFLGACRAGAGDRRLGDDQANPLGAAFMVAGAESVILATTDLRHSPTKRTGLIFWKAFMNGTSPAEALRLARIAQRDAGQDPREFAALNLVGLN